MKKRTIVYGGELYHHGILGQKWGVRNGPPYPLGAEEHSQREKKAGWKKSLRRVYYSSKRKLPSKKTKKNTTSSKLDKKIMHSLNIDEETLQNYKVMATILGVSLATAAGVYLVSRYYTNNSADILSGLASMVDQMNPEHVDSLTQLGEDTVLRASEWNLDDLSTSSLLSDINNIGNSDPVGFAAEFHGYTICENGKDLLESALPVNDYDDLCMETVVNQRTFSLGVADRRLSCWSGSHSWFASMVTGNSYCSRNYQNLVEFNDFGKLYKNKVDIVDLYGNTKKDFVGNPSFNNLTRMNKTHATKMIDTIFNNFKNVNAKNGSIVGFIDASYNNHNCTHQWNFEITKNKVLYMVDCYSGDRYEVGRQNAVGKIVHEISDRFLEELNSYNSNSVRLYSPSVNDLNFDELANVILAKTNG